MSFRNHVPLRESLLRRWAVLLYRTPFGDRAFRRIKLRLIREGKI
jgi:hypothetical protein